MPYFLLRLDPPRPTFLHDMTDEEREIMREHVVYWKGQIARDMLLFIGPVLDPKGVWEMAVLAVDDGEMARQLVLADPVIIAATHTFEILPMPELVKY